MTQKNSDSLIVIGAGVSGLTTAIACQLAGFSVKILTNRLPLSSAPTSDFSSLYPAASIIPHSVKHNDVINLFNESSEIFEHLLYLNYTGIEKHRHYELFSSPQILPSYTTCYPSLLEFEPKIDSCKLNHPSLSTEYGWSFDCLFADWGTYYPALIDEFKRLDGKIILKEVSYENIQSLESEIIINCAEIYGATLIGEDFQPQIYRGHLLHIPYMPKLLNSENQVVSYNFTPGSTVYSTENGIEQDVYFYQRHDRWILGGSRQKGTINKKGQWIGEQVIEPILDIDGVSIPEQVLRLNKEIIECTFGPKEFDLKSATPKVGYRFMGNGEEKLRIDHVDIGDKLIINNLGHGGSGVTLSWGCALRVLDILNEAISRPTIDRERFGQKMIKTIGR